MDISSSAKSFSVIPAVRWAGIQRTLKSLDARLKISGMTDNWRLYPYYLEKP
jgi:hypothetical protein